MSKAKIILPVILLACGIALLLLLLPRRPTVVERSPALAGRIVLYGYTEEGELSWKMTAKEGRIEDEKEDLSDVTILFPQEKTDLIITASSMTQQGGLRRFFGGLRVERGDELRLGAESLVWNDDTDILSADRVELSYGSFEGSGEGFLYDLSKGLSSFSGRVEGRIERDGEISVGGERAEESEGRIVIAGNVLVESGEEEYRCDRLESDRAGEDIVLSGGVTASLPEGRLSGNALRIDPDGISVSGSVVLDLRLEGENGA